MNGADPLSMDSSNNSVMHYATAYGFYEIMTLLLKAGAN